MNSRSRVKFRNLAFLLQRSGHYEKIKIIKKMIYLMESEQDSKEYLEMHKTICANIINHNIVIGININEYNRFRNPFTMAAVS